MLLAAGAERLWLPETVLDVLEMRQIRPVAFRREDLFVMVQPDLLTKADMRRLAKLTPSFMVIGHPPVDCSTPAGLDKLRGLVPMVEAAVEHKPGPNTRYTQPTLAQVHVMVGYWHGPMKPREIFNLVRDMMDDDDLPDTVIRDWIVKWTGSVKRDGNDPAKKPLPPLETDKDE